MEFPEALQHVGNIMKKPRLGSRQSPLVILESAVILAWEARRDQYKLVRMLQDVHNVLVSHIQQITHVLVVGYSGSCHLRRVFQDFPRESQNFSWPDLVCCPRYCTNAVAEAEQ